MGRRPGYLGLVAGCTGMLGLGSLALVGTTPAGAAPSCTGAGTITCTFAFTDAADSFTVPQGVTQITVTALGAQGGDAQADTPGGLGGEATATVAVTPGEVLQVVVGGRAATGNPAPGGFNGGGPSGPGTSGSGGGGGGASDVRRGATGLVVAGGGGGGGGNTISRTPAAPGVAPTAAPAPVPAAPLVAVAAGAAGSAVGVASSSPGRPASSAAAGAARGSPRPGRA